MKRVGTDEPTKEDEEYLYEGIDNYLAKATNCKYFSLNESCLVIENSSLRFVYLILMQNFQLR